MLSIFLSNKTTKILSAILVLLLIAPIGVYAYVKYFKDIAYTSIKDPQIFNVSELENTNFSGENYVMLDEFCVDTTTGEYSKVEGAPPNAFYVFVNNFCDSVKGAVVIVEYDKTTFDQLYAETDSTVILRKYFSGRFYKGYTSSHAPYFQLKEFLDGNDVYTLKAGLTPEKVMQKNMRIFYFSIPICVVIGIVFFVVILQNKTKVPNNP